MDLPAIERLPGGDQFRAGGDDRDPWLADDPQGAVSGGGGRRHRGGVEQDAGRQHQIALGEVLTRQPDVRLLAHRPIDPDLVG